MLTWQRIPTCRIDSGFEAASQNLPEQALPELESIAQDHTHDSGIFFIADHKGGGCIVVFEAVDELSGN
ncbi:hypothetical protein M0R45_003959 [Rubus argutus]|uniref:Uncharacterized protein n=1 Tax=Rubus argutus TaxID=59490 RepID=A0AAW1YGV0_RUBAR